MLNPLKTWSVCGRSLREADTCARCQWLAQFHSSNPSIIHSLPLSTFLSRGVHQFYYLGKRRLGQLSVPSFLRARDRSCKQVVQKRAPWQSFCSGQGCAIQQPKSPSSYDLEGQLSLYTKKKWKDQEDKHHLFIHAYWKKCLLRMN